MHFLRILAAQWLKKRRGWGDKRKLWSHILQSVCCVHTVP